MYRITLKNVLPAALLLAGANAFAADNDVTLASGAKTTWANVVSALNSSADKTLLQARVTQAEKVVADLEKNNQKEVTTTAEWLVNLQAQSKSFASIYDNVVNDDSYNPEQPTIYFKIAKGRGTNATKTLYFSFVEVDNTYTPALPAAFYEAVDADVNGTDATKITSLRIFLGKTDGANNYSENSGFLVETVDGVDPNTIGDVINEAIQSDELTKECQTTEETEEYKAATAELKAAQDALAAAEDTNKEVTYSTITLNGNVTAETTISSEFTGKIIGNGFVINAPRNGVFSNFNGSLEYAAVNGTFAKTEGDEAKFTDVAIWTGSNGKVYNDNSEVTECKTFGETAFAARDNFGVAASNKLAQLTDDESNKVYSIQVYTQDEAGNPTYVTYAGDAFTDLNGRPVTVGDNQFVESKSNDLKVANVFYKDGEKYYAHLVEIKDGVDFFCPVAIEEAEEVKYDREFKAGYNTLFLPFNYKASDFSSKASVGKYDKVNEENKFQFTGISTIPANTPVLVNADAVCTLTTYYASIAKTEPVKMEDCFGILAQTPYTAVTGKVFGLTGNETFMYAGNKSKDLAAFRMYVVYDFPTSGTEENPESQSVSRGITFLEPMDEDMTGIESVDNDANGFAVAGGAGVISINSAADCGNVAVYSVDGRVAANAYVTAGTTTVEVPAGLYIVNGQKVIVK